MKSLNDYRMRLIFVGFVAVMVFSGGSAKADFTFGEPTNLGPPVNSSARDFHPCISPDGLEFYFGSRRPGGYGDTDLWVATRATKDDSWGEPFNLGPLLNTGVRESVGSISSDGLNLYIQSRRAGGYPTVMTTSLASNPCLSALYLTIALPSAVFTPAFWAFFLLAFSCFSDTVIICLLE